MAFEFELISRKWVLVYPFVGICPGDHFLQPFQVIHGPVVGTRITRFERVVTNLIFKPGDKLEI